MAAAGWVEQAGPPLSLATHAIVTAGMAGDPLQRLDWLNRWVSMQSNIALFSYWNRSNFWRETEPFLHFIVHNYDSLPPRILFLHAHAEAWHDPRRKLRSVRKLLSNLTSVASGIRFLSQGGDAFSFAIRDANCIRYWDELFATELGKLPPQWNTPCCSQFVVSRSGITQRAHSFWRRLYHWITRGAGRRIDPDKDISFEILYKLLFGRCGEDAEEVKCCAAPQCDDFLLSSTWDTMSDATRLERLSQRAGTERGGSVLSSPSDAAVARGTAFREPRLNFLPPSDFQPPSCE